MSEQNALQNLLVHAVKGLGWWADLARCVGAKDAEVDRFLIQALAANATGADEIVALVGKAVEFKKQAKAIFEKNNGRAFSGFLPAAAKPFELPADRAGQVALGEQFGAKDPRVRPEIAAVRQQIYDGLKTVAAKGAGSDAAIAAVEQALASLSNDKMDKEEYEAVLKNIAAAK